ncbi:hypothetical protein [Janthinobacterium sp. MP5059B]|uniref:hypothetical protein n=1 Tax=Janthinobacterium sp. MP5059B TaxID=1766683 RepID=UPI00111313C8|nr:hypothetical protein [Janthinobacterium sp. MP5059B]
MEPTEFLKAHSAKRTATALEELAASTMATAADSSAAAKLAAEAAQRSAKWTMVAAIVAAFGMLISAISTGITAAQALHWIK